MSAIEKRYTGKKRAVKGWFFTHMEFQCVLTDLVTKTSRIFWERAHRGNTLPWIISTFQQNKGELLMSRTLDPRPGPTDPTADQRCPNNQFMPRMPGCNADPQTCSVHSPHAKQVQQQIAAFSAKRAELERQLEALAPVAQLYIWRPYHVVIGSTIAVAATSLEEATTAANKLVDAVRAKGGMDNFYAWPDNYRPPIISAIGAAVEIEF